MKLKYPIKAILFDAVGTLIYPEPSVGEAYAAIGAKHGCHLSPDEIQNRFHKAFRRQEELDARNGYRTSEARELERWQTIVAEVFRDQPEPLAPFQELWDHFAKPEAWRCYPDVPGCLKEVWSHELKVGIASNFDSRLRKVIPEFPKVNGHYCISSEIGWKKPHGAFFHAACEILELQAQEVLLIGDDFENDFEAGYQAGLETVLLSREGHSSGRSTWFCIKSLESLGLFLL